MWQQCTEVKSSGISRETENYGFKWMRVNRLRIHKSASVRQQHRAGGGREHRPGVGVKMMWTRHVTALSLCATIPDVQTLWNVVLRWIGRNWKKNVRQVDKVWGLLLDQSSTHSENPTISGILLQSISVPQDTLYTNVISVGLIIGRQGFFT